MTADQVLARSKMQPYRLVMRNTDKVWYWLQTRQDGMWRDVRGPWRQRPAAFRRLQEYGAYQWLGDY